MPANHLQTVMSCVCVWHRANAGRHNAAPMALSWCAIADETIGDRHRLNVGAVVFSAWRNARARTEIVAN